MDAQAREAIGVDSGNDGERQDIDERLLSCYQIVSFEAENRNEQHEYAPHLNENNVLRLCSATGGLAGIDPTLLQPGAVTEKELDTIVAQRLHEDRRLREEDELTAQGVILNAAFGPRSQVRAYLQSRTLWSSAVQFELDNAGSGLFAVFSRPVCLEDADDAVREIVFFSWLPDACFEPRHLRQTAVHMLRYLTSIADHVTFCLAEEDKTYLSSLGNEVGHVRERKSCTRSGYVRERKPCIPSVTFHVQMTEHVQDRVVRARISSCPVPSELANAREIFPVTGAFAGLVAARSVRSVRAERRERIFSSRKDFCEWLSEQATTHSILGATNVIKDSRLQRLLLVKNAIEELNGRDAATKSAFDEDILVSRRDLEDLWTKHQAEIQRAGERVFVTVFFNELQREAQEEAFRSLMRNFDFPIELDSRTKNVLHFPGRLHVVMTHARRLYDEHGTREVDKMLESALEEETSLSWWQQCKVQLNQFSFLVASNNVSSSSSQCDFEQYIEVKLKDLTNQWISELQKILPACKDAASQELHASLSSRYERRIATRLKTAFAHLCEVWRAQAAGGLSLRLVDVASKKSTIKCVFDEDVDINVERLDIWQWERDRHTPLITFDLLRGERLLALFTVMTASLLVVSIEPNVSTFVRRVEVGTDKNFSMTTVQHFRRSIERCSFDPQTRSLVVVDADNAMFLYRLSEHLDTMTHVKTVYLVSLRDVRLPLQSLKITGDDLYLIDASGSVHAMDTRNWRRSQMRIKLQPSRSLFTILEGGMLGWLGTTDDGNSWLRLVASDDGRVIPSADEEPLLGGARDVRYEATDNRLLVVCPSAGQLYCFQLDASLARSSRRLQTVKAASTQDATHQHWLWVMFHLYEKFPVRGFMDRENMQTTPVVSLFCDCIESNERSAVDAGCATLKRLVMSELRRSNIPLHDMDYSASHQSVYSRETIGAMLEGGVLRPVSVLLPKLAVLIPVQVCRAEKNRLKLMKNGREMPLSTSRSVTHDANSIAMWLRFGLLSPLLSSWRSRVCVITSMGKQSTGKSYILNRLIGTSFASAGYRCTDGAWMTARVVAADLLIVVMDFEGLGSLERSHQEEVLLSVLSASISSITILRSEMFYSRDMDKMFTSFQKASELFESDGQLFRGKLSIVVRDVNTQEEEEVFNEFSRKLSAVVEKEPRTFVNSLYSVVEVTCTPPYMMDTFFRAIEDISFTIEDVVNANEDDAVGFRTGAEFLSAVRLMEAKVACEDWKPVADSRVKFQIAEACEALPHTLQYGLARLDIGGNESAPAAPTFDDMCIKYEEYAESWRRLGEEVLLGVPDASITLVQSVDVVAGTVALPGDSILQLVPLFVAQCIPALGYNQLMKKTEQADFGVFVSYIVHRRCEFARAWCRRFFQGTIPEGWLKVEQSILPTMISAFTRCQKSCRHCQLGCMQASGHTGDCDCSSDHACVDECSYCRVLGVANPIPLCSKPAGHDDRCECATATLDHSCKEPCHLSAATNCGQTCAKMTGHETEGDSDHRCSVKVHMCGEPCSAPECADHCVLDLEDGHDAHECAGTRCPLRCKMPGCKRQCRSTDHFHGASADAFHMCDDEHSCPEMCAELGVCDTKVHTTERAVFRGGRETWEYAHHEMRALRFPCGVKLRPQQRSHEGDHSCTATSSHKCDVRCPNCLYYCLKDYGHGGLHMTTHGSMRNTIFLAADSDIDMMEHRYVAGDSGVTLFCNMYCTDRGHVHYLDCEKNEDGECAHAHDAASGRRHCTRELIPTPPVDQDELLHDRYWATLGFEDPCRDRYGDFGMCPFKCDAEEHLGGSTPSYCKLPAFHSAVKEPSGNAIMTVQGQQSLLMHGHHFACSHGLGAPLHTVFVLDASGSMLRAWNALMGAVRTYVRERETQSTEDVISIITFSESSKVVLERAQIDVDFSPECTEGMTNYADALAKAKSLLEKTDSTRQPVLLFLSDGHPNVGGNWHPAAQAIETYYRESNRRLLSFVIGFGYIEISALKSLAEQLGGQYRRVLNSSDLSGTFYTISASVTATAGLAALPHLQAASNENEDTLSRFPTVDIAASLSSATEPARVEPARDVADVVPNALDFCVREETFATMADVARWLLSQSTEFRVTVFSDSLYSSGFAETLLQTCAKWPSRELAQAVAPDEDDQDLQACYHSTRETIVKSALDGLLEEWQKGPGPQALLLEVGVRWPLDAQGVHCTIRQQVP